MKPAKLRALTGAFDRSGGDAPDDGDGIDAATLLRLRSLLGELSAAGAPAELEALGRELRAHSGEIHAAATAWIGLVEALVQDAEGRHPKPRRGALKLEEVKWVVAYLLRREKVRIPGLPRFLDPLVDDALADLTVDSLVAVLNDHGLLKGTPVTRRARLSGEVRWIARQLARPIELLLRPLGRLAGAVYTALRFRRVTSPAMRSALAAVDRQIDSGESGLFDSVSSLVSWLAAHRSVVAAAAQLVGIAVNEAETFASLDGAGKKRFAENSVLAVLSDLGIGNGPFGGVVVGFFVDVAIDGIVGVFNERGFFSHRST